MATQITLTRKQLERIITLIGIDDRVESVTIVETYTSGIGASHHVLCHTSKIERDYQADITDVEVW
jgi:hypothetical protein